MNRVFMIFSVFVDDVISFSVSLLLIICSDFNQLLFIFSSVCKSGKFSVFIIIYLRTCLVDFDVDQSEVFHETCRAAC